MEGYWAHGRSKSSGQREDVDENCGNGHENGHAAIAGSNGQSQDVDENCGNGHETGHAARAKAVARDEVWSKTAAMAMILGIKYGYS